MEWQAVNGISFQRQVFLTQIIIGGKLDRKIGSVKTEEQIKTEYREVIGLFRNGYSIRNVAKLSGKSIN